MELLSDFSACWPGMNKGAALRRVAFDEFYGHIAHEGHSNKGVPVMIVRTWKSLPRLVRFILRNIALGVTIGWAFLTGILYMDLGGLYSMISHSPFGFAAIFLLMGGFAVTFGPAAVASAVLLGYEFEDDNDAGKAPPAPVTHLRPAEARVAAKR